MKVIKAALLAATAVFSANALALNLTSPAFQEHSNIPYQYGYCQPNDKGEAKAGDDISPSLHWSNAPKGTKSFALILTDPDIPNTPNFNKKGTIIKKDVKRVTGYHWILVNIPASEHALPEGAGSKGFVKGGKPTGKTPYGLTGINVYNGAFKSPLASIINYHHMTKAQMNKTYGDYDGPCPPWNDNAIHHYTFTLYALNITKLDLPANGKFTGPDAVKAMKGHILAKTVLIGNFITNPTKMK